MVFVPEGRHENSPAIYRWEQDRIPASPGGTAEAPDFIDARSSLRDWDDTSLPPSDKSLGYSRRVPPGQNAELLFLEVYSWKAY